MKDFTLVSTRKGAFETNSSSSHSLVLARDGDLMYPKLTGPLVLTGGEYGWEDLEYAGTNWIEKINYLLTFCFQGVEEDDKKTLRYDEELLDLLLSTVAQHLLISKYDIEYPTHLEEGSSWCDMYIDHESDGLPGKIFREGIMGILDFVFSPHSYFTTSNDNDGSYHEQWGEDPDHEHFKIIKGY